MNTWLEQLKGVLNIFRERDLMIVKFNGDRAWNHCLVISRREFQWDIRHA